MRSRGLLEGRRVRALLAILPLVLSLSLAAALPAFAAGPLSLSEGQVSPGSGTDGDRFAFAVTYLSKDDVPAAWVGVLVDGATVEMGQLDTSDTDFRDGARYRVTVTLDAGDHAYSFAASDGKDRTVELAGGTISVAPRPTPQPTPRPTPAPTPQPTPAPTPAPTPQPTPAPTPQPTPAPTPAPTSNPTPTATADPLTGGPPAGGQGPDASPSNAPGGALSGGGITSGPGTDGTPGGGGAVGGGPAGSGSGSGSTIPTGNEPGPAGDQPPSGAIALLAAGLPGFGGDEWLLLAARSAAISAAASAAVAMALFTFKRRRHDEDEDEPLPRGTERHVFDGAGSDGAAGGGGAAVGAGGPMAASIDANPETSMPRWRRPSLAAARKAETSTDLAAMASERLTFDRGVVAADDDRERRRIRYRMVRLTDSPDELRGAEIGRLDEDDEVELLERAGLYWQVLTPLGQVGWVHKMTLGDLVAPDATSHAPGAEDLDDDVRTAFGELQLRQVFEPRPETMLGGEGLAAQFVRERGIH